MSGRWGGTLVVEGHRIAVDVRGDRPSLLLVNGLGGGAAAWEPFRAALPPGIGTIAYDAPGCGRSEPARRFLSVRGHADLAAGVAEALDTTEIDVLGFSFGGLVAQQLAFARPDLVRRLVLVSTAFGVGSWPGSWLATSLLAAAPTLLMPAGVGVWGPFVFGGHSVSDSVQADRGRALLSDPPDSASYTQQLLAAGTWSGFALLGLLRQPTLLVAGDQDPLVPVCNAAAMSMVARRARLHVLRAAGHLLMVDRAADVATAVSGFLDETDASARG